MSTAEFDGLDLEPALRKMHEWALADGDVGYSYWNAVGRILEGARVLTERVQELEEFRSKPGRRSASNVVNKEVLLLALAAEAVFVTPDQAAAWLKQPHPLLKGATPLIAARCNSGRRQVRDILLAIRHGLPV